MAVATARRMKADRPVKERLLNSLILSGVSFTDSKMPSDKTTQSSSAGAQIPLSHPVFKEDAHAARGGPEPEVGLKKRKGLKGKIPSEIRRSASSPHIRGLAIADSSALSPTDKRRNKLGYHRTSVACGHCRRRKIRCLLPSPEDPHGRCANCIRLKKDCNFFPVDQAVSNEQRPQNGSKKEASSSVQSASAQSSPRISAPSHQTSSHDGAQELVQSAHPVQDTHHGSASPRYGVHSATGAHYQGQQFAFPNPLTANWGSNAPQPHESHPPQQVSPSYWHAANRPSNYGGVANTTLQHGEAVPYQGSNLAFQQESQSWSVPSRSMSFGHIEGMPHQYAYHELHAQPGAPGPLSSYHLAPHPQGNIPSFSSSESRHGAMTVAGAEEQLPSYGLQKSWSGIPPDSTYKSAGEPHGLPVLANQWYPQPPSFVNAAERQPNVSYEQTQQYYSEPSNTG